jgi:hypothetical protein
MEDAKAAQQAALRAPGAGREAIEDAQERDRARADARVPGERAPVALLAGRERQPRPDLDTPVMVSRTPGASGAPSLTACAK